MKGPLFLITFLMLLAASATGQENYQKAYIVTLKGDTIHGFINYRDWGVNPRRIGFKKTLNGKKSIYKPLGIKSFFVHGELYQSAVIKSETSNSDFASTMSRSPKVKTSTDSTFLKVLVSGSKSLFFYKNPLNIENFYILQDGKPVLLIYKKYIREDTGKQINSKSYILENKKYVGQLTVYFKDCPKIRSRIAAAVYSNSSLINIFKAYYKCKNETPKSVQKTKKIKVILGVFVGAANTKFGLFGNGFSEINKMKYSQSFDACGGVAVDMVLREWSIHNEIEYTSFSSDGTFNSTVAGYYTDYNATFGYSSISINNLVRFTHTFGPVSIFANVGISNGFILNFTNHKETINGGPNSTNPTIVESEFIKPSDLGKTDFAYLSGAGLIYKNFNLEFRYEARYVNFNNKWYSAKLHRASIRLGYTF